jgi:predicted kinase
MGAGKSTVGDLLHKQLKRTALLNRDTVKWYVSDYDRSKKDILISNAVLMRMCDEYLKQGISLIIPQGFWKEKSRKKEYVSFSDFAQLAKKYKAKLYIYHLDAPANTLLARVKKRKPSNPTNPFPIKRTKDNINKWKSNRFDLGETLNTEKSSTKEIVDFILSDSFNKKSQ